MLGYEQNIKLNWFKKAVWDLVMENFAAEIFV